MEETKRKGTPRFYDYYQIENEGYGIISFSYYRDDSGYPLLNSINATVERELGMRLLLDDDGIWNEYPLHEIMYMLYGDTPIDYFEFRDVMLNSIIENYESVHGIGYRNNIGGQFKYYNPVSGESYVKFLHS